MDWIFAVLMISSSLPLTVAPLSPPDKPAAPSPLRSLVRLLNQTDDQAVRADVLRGMCEALQGRRQVPMPAGWPAVYRKLTASGNAEVRERAMLLAVQFGDAEALAALRRTVTDASAAAAVRRSALQALIYHKNPDLVPVLHALLADPALRGTALRGLAAFPDAATPAAILQHYDSFTDQERNDAIQTLTARPAYALALLDAVAQGRVPRRDLSAFTIRQMLGLKNKQVEERVRKVWGEVRPASQDKAALLARYKTFLTPDYLKTADPSRGRAIFARTCATCHVLFGEGARIGPELTGAQRGNLDYVLGKVLDPSAVVADDYRVTLLQTRDGRLITGIVKDENDKVITVQTPNEVLHLPKEEVEGRRKSPLSLMPEGLLAALRNDEVRDLIAYLGAPAQVPLPKSP